jgi:hypothetical protein
MHVFQQGEIIAIRLPILQIPSAKQAVRQEDHAVKKQTLQ